MRMKRSASSLPRETALGHLMEENDLTQSDLAEVGSQGVVSEVLRGENPRSWAWERNIFGAGKR
jgi:antitoxin component HigA of HigAB toxin-antitoxin module